MKLHQGQVILLVSSRYQTGVRGEGQTKNVVSTNQFNLIFILFHQASPRERLPDELTPLDVYMPVIGKCL